MVSCASAALMSVHACSPDVDLCSAALMFFYAVQLPPLAHQYLHQSMLQDACTLHTWSTTGPPVNWL